MTATTTRPPAAASPPAADDGRGSRLGRWLNSWRVSLKMARRDARRYRGRSALIVVMVALPVALIVGGLTFGATSSLSPAEKVPIQLGTAVAQIDSVSSEVVVQGPDGGYGYGSSGERPPAAKPIPGYSNAPDAPIAEQAAALGRLVGGTIVPISYGEFRWTAGERRPYGSAMFVDPKFDLGARAKLVSGRWPTSYAEVAVTPLGIHEGLPKEGTLTAKIDGADRTLSVVGVVDARSFDWNTPHVVTTGPWNSEHASMTTFLVMRDAPMPWSEVRRLNEYGLSITSRAVAENPPQASELAPEAQITSGDDVAAMRLAAAMLGSTLFVITALLVGPAFAVSAGRQRRSLALAASNGAETRQLRRSVLASAVVLGVLAVAAGAVLGAGLAAAAAAYWRSSRPWSTLFGPIDIPWVAVVIVCVCAMLAAMTAALIPALRLGRLDIIGVMKGQNVSPPHSRKLPVIGLIVFAIGTAGAFYAVANASAAGAVIAMLGLLIGPLLLIPILLVWAGRLAARFPVSVRMATRDAARQRHRAVPTVAAVMAGAALLATFAVGTASDTKFQARQYIPTTVAGEGNAYYMGLDEAELKSVIATHAPNWKIVPEYAVAPDPTSTTTTGEPFLSIVPEGCTPQQSLPDFNSDADPWGDRTCLRASSMGGPDRAGVSVLPAEEIVRRVQLSGEAAEAVRKGSVLVADAAWAPGGKVTLAYGEQETETGAQTQERPPTPAIRNSETAEVPARVIPPEQYARGGVDNFAGLVMSKELADKLGVITSVSSQHLYDPAGPISKDAEKKVVERLSMDGALRIERGFEPDYFRIMLVVFAIAAFLLITVTLISTSLALAEQQSDMGTLAAVGATKGTRRRFAAAQAATVAAVGVGLGIVVGLVAGVALAYPSTSHGWDAVTQEQITLSPTIGIPVVWLGAILIGVPIVAALIAAASVRKAPTVTRRD